MNVRNLLLVLAGIAIASAEFLYPPQGKVIFRVGQVHCIRYKTNWKEYNIALWQESKAGNSATLGPVVYGEC